EDEDRWVRVHAKVLVADDRLLRIGSSNLSNRSMGVDSECDLAVVAEDAPTRQAIDRFRDRLVAEHLGRRPEEVATAVAARGLIGAIEQFGTGERELRPIEAELSEDPAVLAAIEAECGAASNPFDPERPIRPDSFLEDFLPDISSRSKLWLRSTVWMAALLLF